MRQRTDKGFAFWKKPGRILVFVLLLSLAAAPLQEVTAAPDETVSDEAVSDEAVSGETVSDETVSEETAPEETVSDETVPEEDTDSSGEEFVVDADAEPEDGQDIEEEEPENIVDDEIIVVYDDAGVSEKKSEAIQKEAEEALADIDIEVSEDVIPAEDEQGTIATARIPDEMSVEEAVDQAMEDENISYAQPNFIYDLMENAETAETNDSYVQKGQTYYLKNTKILEAWEDMNYQSSAGVTVAVLDTGCRLDHEDLRGNICSSLAYDAYYNRTLTAGNTPNGGDPQGHGTHVAGLVAAEAGNGIGIAGTSYNAKILPVKIYDNYGSNATTSTILKGFNYCKQLIDSKKVSNLRVINISSGYYSSGTGGADLLCEDAIDTLTDDYNVLTVCSGGNGDNVSTPCLEPMYPSDFDSCLSVTALDENGKDCAWSDYNRWKDISAPGKNILSTYISASNSYTTKTGTSMAAPIVSGICAFLWAAKPDASVQEIVTAIESTADEIVGQDINRQSTGSYGAINAKKALEYLRGNTGTEQIELTSDNLKMSNFVEKFKYNCERFEQESVVFTVNGKTLKKGTDYTVTYRDNVNAGTAKMIVNGMGAYKGTVQKTFQIEKNDSFSSLSVQISKLVHAYTGKEIKPEIIISYEGERFIEGIDYTLSYENNIEIGTGKVKLQFKNFTKTGVVSFTITKADVSGLTASLSASSYTYNKKARKPSVTVKNGTLTLVKGKDYSVSYSGNIKVGTATVKITGTGTHYTGTLKKTFRILPKGTSISKLTKKSKGFTVKWKKQATQTTGYQIQYSTSKKFTSAKTKTIKKVKTTSTSVSKLKKKKTYYVRIRTYRTVNGVKYYSGWSKIKKVKTK